MGGFLLLLFSLLLFIALKDALGKYAYADFTEESHFYFIVSSEISVYLVKMKVVSVTSEMVSYHFTCD